MHTFDIINLSAIIMPQHQGIAAVTNYSMILLHSFFNSNQHIKLSSNYHESEQVADIAKHHSKVLAVEVGDYP